MAFSSRTYAPTICTVLSLVASACTQQASESPAATFPSVTMPDTEVRTLNSSNTGRKYDIYIRLPAGYARNEKNLPVRLFLAVGELEALAQPVEEFMQVVSERGYEGLDMEALVIEGERHASNKPEVFNRGLRFIFQDE